MSKEAPDHRIAQFRKTKYEFSKERLDELHASYKGRTDIKDYIINNSDIKPEVLPYAAIASKAIGEYGANLAGKKAILSSEITTQRGLASSGSCALLLQFPYCTRAR